MHRKLLLLMAGIFLVSIFTGCAQQSKQEPSPAKETEKKAIELKLAHQWPQEPNDYVIATGIKFVEEVEKRTNGQVKIKFYPAESLVKAGDTHTALKNGTIDMSIYPYIYAAGAIPEMNLILMPALWKNHDEVFAFKKSEPWKYLEEKMNKDLGIKTLSWIQISGGIASVKKPVRTPADVAGLKWRGAGKYTEAMLKGLGGGTVTMPSSELYTSMQRGILDAMLTSSSSFAAFRIQEVAKHYLSPENYSIYFTIEPICISMKAWEKLTPEQQKVMLQVGSELEDFALQGAKKEDGRVAKLFQDAGAKVEKMTKEQFESFLKAAQEHAYPKFKQEVPKGDWLLNSTFEFYKKK